MASFQSLEIPPNRKTVKSSRRVRLVLSFLKILSWFPTENNNQAVTQYSETQCFANFILLDFVSKTTTFREKIVSRKTVFFTENLAILK